MSLVDKALTLLAMPVGATIACALAAGIAWLFRWRRTSGALVVAAFAWIWFWATPLSANLALPLLGERYPLQRIEALPPADAIVVLAGDVRAGGSNPYPQLGRTGDAIAHAVRLHRAKLAPVIIVSGGVLGRGQSRPMAGAMRDALVALGVPEDAVLVEGRSRTTRENALFTAELAAERGIEQVLLVTFDLHMRRSLAAFRKAGLAPVPVVYQHSGGARFRVLDPLPSIGQLSRSSFVLREWLGLLIYRLRDWT